MSFTPFDEKDFEQTGSIQSDQIPEPLATKITELRQGLGSFPEFQLEFFSRHIVRRPRMHGIDGLVFGRPRPGERHWYLYIVGGDQDQVQLNVGMYKDYMRVGMGFMMGRQVALKIPALHVLQCFLGMRPPLPFRNALLRCIKQHNFQIESPEGVLAIDAEGTIHRLETYVVPSDDTPVFIFLGAIWYPSMAASKTLDAYRSVFRALMPFYEELLLAGGRYEFHI